MCPARSRAVRAGSLDAIQKHRMLQCATVSAEGTGRRDREEVRAGAELRPGEEVVGLSVSCSNIPVSGFVDARGREEAGAELGSAEEVVGPSAARKDVPVSRFVDARGSEEAVAEMSTTSCCCTGRVVSTSGSSVFTCVGCASGFSRRIVPASVSQELGNESQTAPSTSVRMTRRWVLTLKSFGFAKAGHQCCSSADHHQQSLGHGPGMTSWSRFPSVRPGTYDTNWAPLKGVRDNNWIFSHHTQMVEGDIRVPYPALYHWLVVPIHSSD